MRQATVERQKALGVVPADTQMAPMPSDIPNWDDLSMLEKCIFQRQMEVFAGFTTHVDHHIGRVLDALDRLDESRWCKGSRRCT